MSVSKSAGAIEGGEFHCFIHDNFTTSNAEAWYKHCEAKDATGKPVHTESGSGECVFCHTKNIPFQNLPWTRPGTTKGVVCDTCKKSQLGGSK